MSIPKRTPTVLIAALLTAVLTACGATVSGTGVPGEIDVRSLDVGAYPTEPPNAHDDDPVPAFYEMYKLAAMRIADYAISAYDIDPQMIYGNRADANNARLMPSELGNETAMSAIAQKHKMLYGFHSSGASKDLSVSTSGTWPTKKDNNWFTATTMILQFPDAERATAAAREFHDADFAAQEGRNQPVSLPKYPAAHAQWRPDAPFVRVLLPHGPYVIAFLLSVARPDLPALTALAESALTKQIESLAAITPLTDEQLMTLPWDPDHLLMRTLNPEGLTSPEGSNYLVTGAHGIQHYSGGPLPDHREYLGQQLTKMNAQQVAISWGSIGIRTPDAESARRAVVEKLFLWPTATDVAPPPNLTEAACVENKQLAAKKRFSCILAYKQYVGIVSSEQLLDAQQRAAAQYAVFANSR
ncbi:hypothetical protein ATM97_11805 [Nocardia sp. MH4]|uniref:DUF7373 family lipoprotein n=1 Tax=Nocardia sp. MH4 TaxID=1768677 RepID=UPI001C4F1D16|nr:hypothetical protein [Nocardia sp. MH4]MBW0271437.1 hypothetical protein [Nocardia sp. MH4]